MDHTFLFQEGLWLAEGIYYDENAHPLPFSGFAEITHTGGIWINRNRMDIRAGGEITIENNYLIKPFPEGGDSTTWESENPVIGLLLGKFYVVGDSIISTCTSQRGTYSGTEFLVWKSPSDYISRGVFCDGTRKLSSWTVDLKKTR
jgi:hypothetical protein